jgi:hypothetical protein
VKAVDALKDRFGIAAILQVFGVAASTCYGASEVMSQERTPVPPDRDATDPPANRKAAGGSELRSWDPTSGRRGAPLERPDQQAALR